MHVQRAHKNLERLVRCDATFDFDALFAPIRHSATDTGIKEWRAFEFSFDAATSHINLRTKKHMSSPTWSDPFQFWPNGSGVEMPGPQRPALAEFKEWDRDEVEKDLTWFTEQQSDVRVTPEVQHQLRTFFAEIPEVPASAAAPAWPRVLQHRQQQRTEQKQDEANAQAEADAGAAAAGAAAAAEEEEPMPYGTSRNVREANARFQALNSVTANQLLVLVDAAHNFHIAQVCAAKSLRTPRSPN